MRESLKPILISSFKSHGLGRFGRNIRQLSESGLVLVVHKLYEPDKQKLDISEFPINVLIYETCLTSEIDADKGQDWYLNIPISLRILACLTSTVHICVVILSVCGREIRSLFLQDETSRKVQSSRRRRRISRKSVILQLSRLKRHQEFQKRSLALCLNLKPKLTFASDLPALPSLVWYKLISRKKVILDCHEFFSESSGLGEVSKKYWQIIESLYLKKADRISVVNSAIAAQLEKKYQVSSEVRRNLPDKVVKSKRSLRVDLRDNKSTIMVYVGGFSEGRGLLEIAKAFCGCDIKTKLAYVGFGPLVNDIRLNACKRCVYILPPVRQSEIIDYISSADIGLLPYIASSVNNDNSLPNKFFEYIFANLPVLARNTSVVSEIIKSDSLGMIYTNEFQISEKLQELLEKKLNYQRSVSTFRRRLDWGEESKMLTKWLSELV